MQQPYGTSYSVFTVQGYEWDALHDSDRASLHNLLLSNDFRGHPLEHFGFASTQVLDEVYYGHFTQQFAELVTNYKTPSVRETNTVFPFEDRFYLFIPRHNLLVLERRRFMRQPGLTPSKTEERITALLQEALPNFQISLEKYSHDYSVEEMREFFFNYQVVGVSVEGLRNREVPEGFIFFNPHFEKNAISRDLFNSKILPFMDAVSVTTEAYTEPGVIPLPNDDLRKNALARVAVTTATAIKEVAVQDPEKGRRHLKPHYDDLLKIDVETSDPEGVTAQILEKIQDLPNRRVEIKVRLPRQRTLFDRDDAS